MNLFSSNTCRFLALAIAGLACHAGAADTVATSTTATNAPGRYDFNRYRVVQDRNIFNTRRSARNTPAPERRDTRRFVRSENVVLVGTLSYEKGPFAFFEGSSSAYTKVAKKGDEIAGFKVVDIRPHGVKLESGTNQLELPVAMQLKREDQGPWKLTERDEPRQDSRYSSSSSTASSRPQATITSGANPPGSGDFPAPPGFPSIPGLPSIPGFPGAPGEDGPQVMIFQAGADGQAVVGLEVGEGSTNITIRATEAGPGPGPENDVLRRLMERRQQEMNR